MAECSCIRGNYNFYTEALDKDTIVYQDLSDWMEEEGYDSPTEYVVTITPPLSTQSVAVTMKVGEMNRIGSDEIGTVRDGVYCFETTSCGEYYTRTHAIFPYMECCVKKAWATLGIEWHGRILEVEYHLKLASIQAELQNIQLASNELKVASKLLENIKCDCDC